METYGAGQKSLNDVILQKKKKTIIGGYHCISIYLSTNRCRYVESVEVVLLVIVQVFPAELLADRVMY